jgi:hypothetical protein
MENETVWLSQAQMCELFDKNKRTISEHIRNIFSEGELQEEQVVRKFRTTAPDGKKYLVAHYNLDVIISVGYRVKSHRGTQFRIWATQRLREYIIKGFAMDDERLKQIGGGNYFDELLARIRDIRSSEKIFWRKVLDIYATSIDIWNLNNGQCLHCLEKHSSGMDTVACTRDCSTLVAGDSAGKLHFLQLEGLQC